MNKRNAFSKGALVGAAVLSVLGVIGAAWAQDTSRGIEEIMVTARKRQESILKVPVVATAISAERLQRFNVTEMTDLPKMVPGMNLGHSLLSIGTLISVRGIGTSTQDPGVDQSVSLNIDGLSLGNGLALNSGMFDLGQVEVLKGPQGLFYGKSSPGGVVSLRTADPTDKFEVVARAEYEFISINRRTDLVISGPINDKLKLRLAGQYSAAHGYFKNEAIPAPGTGAQVQPYVHDQRASHYVIRGTALYDPSDRLSARLKVNAVHDRTLNADTAQYTSCPSGTGPVAGVNIPFVGGGEDCKLDNIKRTIAMDPASFPAALNHGIPFLETWQNYGTLELNYHFDDALDLSSTTAYYHLRSRSLVNSSESAYAGPNIAVNNHYRRHELTEEVRLNSNYKGPLNFTLGALYEDGYGGDRVGIMGNKAFGRATYLADGLTPIDIKTYSAFGQLRYKITPELELAGGLRWTDEKRTEAPFNFLTNAPTIVPTPQLHTKHAAPEATLTYTPTDDLTVFAAFKEGYKSGSFSIATPAVTNTNNAFGDEKVVGGELGMKSRLLDRQLSLNVAGYYYHYSGLQLGANLPPRNGLPVIQTINAASAKAYGLDIEAAYRPASLEGLSLNGAVNWNHARFIKFTNAPCWGGQLVSEGCNQVFNATTGLYTAQDLSGTPLIRAPEWQINFGFEYEYAINANYNLILSSSNEYSSKFATFLAINRPNQDNFQRAFAKADLSLTLRSADNRWEVAAIGKNVTEKVTAGLCSSSNYSTSSILGNSFGGTTRGPIGINGVACFADPGREIWLRVTVRPFAARD